MSKPVVFCVYQAKAGQEKKLETLIRKHSPLLRSLGLLSERPELALKVGSGFYLEVVEWGSKEGGARAHEIPEVQKLWNEMAEVCEFTSLNKLPEAILSQPFAKVEALDAPKRQQVYSDNMISAKNYPELVKFYSELLKLRTDTAGDDFSMLVDPESTQRLCITNGDAVEKMSVGVASQDLAQTEAALTKLGGQVLRRWEFGKMKGMNALDPEGNGLLVWQRLE